MKNIQNQRSEKNRRKKYFCRIFDEKHFSIEMSMKIDFSKIDFHWHFNGKIFFVKKSGFFLKLNFFQDFFLFRKKSSEKIFLSISIRNFPRIPKIILRNSCDEYKDPKNKKIAFFYIKSTDLNLKYPQLCESFVHSASSWKHGVWDPTVQEIHEIYSSERHIRRQISFIIHNSLRSCSIVLKMRKMDSL